MPFFDQHLHSRHSCDSVADPVANVNAAVDRGLAGLTFTEHYDTHPDDWPTCVYDDEAYSATIESLRRRFESRIVIGKGIEVCFQPDRMDDVCAFLRSHTFDLVILSVHYFGDRALHKRDHWDGIDVASGTRRYLENVLAAARYCESVTRKGERLFDVLGHLDLVKRYAQRFFGTHGAGEHFDLIDAILDACLRADLVPEINTSTLRQGLDETMPGITVVQRYADLGGQAMSIGSDAHRAADIGAGFDVATRMLADAGIGRVAVFDQRQRVDHSLTTNSEPNR